MEALKPLIHKLLIFTFAASAQMGMRRRLSNIICTAAFALLMGTVMLWVRSYWCFDEFGWPAGRYLTSVGSVHGRVFMAFGSDFPYSAKQGWHVAAARTHRLEHEFVGFGYRDRFITKKYHVHAIAFPIVLPILLLLPAAILFVLRRGKTGSRTPGFEVQPTHATVSTSRN